MVDVAARQLGMMLLGIAWHWSRATTSISRLLTGC